MLELVATEATAENGGLLPDLRPVVTVLSNFLDHDTTRTRMAVLRWILHLYRKLPVQMQSLMDTVFPMLLNVRGHAWLLLDRENRLTLTGYSQTTTLVLAQVLSDDADQVVLLDLEVLSEISRKESGNETDKDYFQQFVNSLLELFRNDQKYGTLFGTLLLRFTLSDLGVH